MANSKRDVKPGRRQVRYRAPSSNSISTDPLDWPALDAACGITFSEEAKRQILFAQGNYKMMRSWPSITRTEFLDDAARMRQEVRVLRRTVVRRSGGAASDDDEPQPQGPFAAAIRAALARSGMSETGIEWDEANRDLVDALNRVEGMLQCAEAAPKEDEAWPDKEAWERYVAAIVAAFQFDGHPITANNEPETPLVTFLRMIDLRSPHGVVHPDC